MSSQVVDARAVSWVASAGGNARSEKEARTMDRPKSTPRDVFMYVLAMITLYVSTVGLITLLFQYVDLLLPDALDLTSFRSFTIRWSLAELIVLFPVYLWSSVVLEGEAARDPEKANLRVRKWLLYLTLFLAGLLILCDLVGLVYQFLGGELTLRFVLKVVSIFVVAGAIFAYYSSAVHRTPGEPLAREKPIAIAAGAAVLIIVIVGIFTAGSPARARSAAFDDQKVNNLRVVQIHIVTYWTSKGRLPNSLDDLVDSIAGFTPPVDPQSRQPYVYRVTGPRTFELCATFNLPSERSETSPPVMVGLYPMSATNWTHGSGLVCFKRSVDPALYRPTPPPVRAAPAPPAPMTSTTPLAIPPR
jgi:Domain of unknown function (DUF5671)